MNLYIIDSFIIHLYFIMIHLWFIYYVGKRLQKLLHEWKYADNSIWSNDGDIGKQDIIYHEQKMELLTTIKYLPIKNIAQRKDKKYETAGSSC